MALVAVDSAAVGTAVTVDIRGTAEPAGVVPLPFYKRADRPAVPRAETTPS
jgi:hypothetical protein